MLLPVGEFGNILRESTDEKLTITVSDSGTVVEGQYSKFQLANADPDEFPAVPEFTATSYVELQASVLKELIRRTFLPRTMKVVAMPWAELCLSCREIL